VLTARARRLRFRRLVFALLAHRAVLDCSLRSLRIALGSRLLRRRSTTKSASAHSSSTQLAAGAGARYARAFIGGTAACDPLLDCSLRSLRIALGGRLLRHPQRRKARRLTPPQHSSPLGLVLATLARLLRHGGARPLLIARCRAAMFGKCRRIRQASRTPGVTNGGLVITKVS
jgi:hypothetical protein